MLYDVRKLRRRIGIAVMLLLLSSYVNQGAEAGLEQAPTEPDAVEICATKLLSAVGKTGIDSHHLPTLYRKNSVVDDTLFLKYMFSVIYVESRFNRNAVSHRDARGLMQMTRIAVEESTRYCRLRPVMDMNRLHDSVTNIRYGSCYLRYALQQAEGDWTRALILYNGGFLQLSKYDRGEAIAAETANYVLAVERALNRICRAN